MLVTKVAYILFIGDSGILLSRCVVLVLRERAFMNVYVSRFCKTAFAMSLQINSTAVWFC